MKPILILVLLLIVGLLASPVGTEAHHKPDHSKGPPQTLDASFQVTPNPAVANSSMFIEGFDFEPGEPVQIMIQENWCCIWGVQIPDAKGEFSFTTRTRDPGTYKICGLVDFEKGTTKTTDCGTGKGTLVAFLEFKVN